MRSGATYWPSLLVGWLRATPVLVTVMVALGTAAPVGSVTVPTTVASCATAETANMTKAAARRIARREPLRLTAEQILAANVDERDVIWCLRNWVAILTGLQMSLELRCPSET